jgi:hypothetical protein
VDILKNGYQVSVLLEAAQRKAECSIRPAATPALGARVIKGYQPPTPAPEPDVVVLTMTLEEAETLKAVVGAILGSPTASRRKHMDLVYHRLCRAGVSAPSNSGLDGLIRFHDRPVV